MAQTEPTQNILNFGGLVTNTTPDKIPDRNATNVKNIDFSLNGMIQSSRGYELYGNKITDAGNCVDAFLYQKIFGTFERIKMRTRDNGTSIVLEWLNPNNVSESTDGQWEVLLGGLTTGTKMGFASVNGDGGSKVNRLIMGNAVDAMMVWNGATATVASVTANTIVCNESLLLEGFDTAGTVTIDGANYTYTGITSKTFTGVTSNPVTGGAVANMGVAQVVNTTLLTEHIYTATTIAFVTGVPSTITDSANGFVTAGFTVGQKISVTGSDDNSGTWTIAEITAGIITLAANEIMVSEALGKRITIQAGSPKGNILLAAQRKLFLSGNTDNPSKVYYSQSGECTCFGITTGLGSGGSFELVEGGGPVTCLESKGKNTVVCHKRDAIIAYTRDNDGANAIESFDNLSSSHNSGASSFKARTSLNKSSFFATRGEGVKLLEQAVEENILAMASITDIIAPTLQEYDMSNAVAAYFPPKKVILVAADDSNGDRKQIAIYVKGGAGNFTFDVSIDDIPVADYIVDGSDLYFVSTLDQNCYKLFARNSANSNTLNHKYATKEYTFESPAQDKEFDTIYVEGLINENGKLRITVEYGILGQDGSVSYVVRWDDNSGDNAAVSPSKISALGTSTLGETSLGGNDAEIQDSYIFSLPIHFDAKRSTRYKVVFETYYDEDTTDDHETYWAVMNCSADTRLLDLSKLKMRNSNDHTGSGIESSNIGYSLS
jgi:hypothetical protein